MGWDLDGRIGSVVIDGRERVGLAWVRDRTRKRIVFHALPLRDTLVAADDEHPPGAEQFVVDEAAFKPVFSPAWANRGQRRRIEPV